MDTKQKKEQETISLSVKDLLEAGTHFGHQRHRWNPKMKKFIFEERNGLHIIDLAKTLQLIRNAVAFIRQIVVQHKSILFVGTKKQAKAVVRELAESCDEFYVCERWLGGTLTNLATIRNSVKKLERIEKRIAAADEGLTKKELSQLTKDQMKLEKNLSGIRAMRKLPGLLIVVDPNREHLAVAEAKRLGIPVMGLVDTNCDPEPIDFVIPGNDDALKSIKLCLETLARAVNDQKKVMNIQKVKEEADDGHEDVPIEEADLEDIAPKEERV